MTSSSSRMKTLLAQQSTICFFGFFGHKEVVGDQDRFLFYYSGHGSNETGIGQMQFSQADPHSYNGDTESFCD